MRNDEDSASSAWGLRGPHVASGDIRNVVETVISVPDGLSHGLSIVINDKDLDIVARNLILLLIAYVVDDAEQAVDCMIHFWYSAMLTKRHTSLFSDTVLPLLKDVCTKINSRAPGSLLGKTWTFKSGSLRLVLTKESWFDLLSSVTAPATLTPECANEARKAIMLAHAHRDNHDLDLFERQPRHRVCLARFREDGILLPFGHSRASFDQPNLTMYINGEWNMPETADQFAGWSYPDVLQTQSGPATNDICGQLFRYIEERLVAFHKRLRSRKVDFQMLNMYAQELHKILPVGTFARVDVRYSSPSLTNRDFSID